jgi:hypothetical protein
MSEPWHHGLQGGKWPERLVGLAVPAVALIAITFVAYYRRFSSFGMYGDDHYLLGSVVLRDWSAEFANLWLAFKQWQQGRPLAFGFTLGIVPHVWFQLGGLRGFHLGAFAALSTTTILLYALLRRVYPTPVAFAGAAFYALSPVDTVQLSLIYAYNFEIAMLVAVLAAHAALSGRAILFAVLVAASMCMHEPAVMFALIVPLFLLLDRGEAKPTRIHLLVRQMVGDDRVSSMVGNRQETIYRAVTSARFGLVTYVDTVLERLILPLREADRLLYGVVAGCGAIAFAALAWLHFRSGRLGGPSSIWRKPRALPLIVAGIAAATPFVLSRFGVPWLLTVGGMALAAIVWSLFKDAGAKEIPATATRPRTATLVAAGITTMAATYLTYFRLPWYPAVHNAGFLSGVHVVAALGAALAVAGLVQGLLTWLPRSARWAALAAVAGAIGMLGGFGELIQRDYASSWSFQRDFWHAYRRLCRDAIDGTFVLVVDHETPPRRFIEDFSWGSEVLPRELYRYPGAPEAPITRLHAPVVIRIGRDPSQTMQFENGRLRWNESPDFFMLPKSEAEQPHDGNVILLDRHEGQWRRIEGVLQVSGGTLHLRPATGDFLDRLPPTRLAPVYGL